MTTRPILFSGPMVRAILDGRKTMTRRIVKPQPVRAEYAGYVVESTNAKDTGTFAFLDAPPPHGNVVSHVRCPYGQPGDILWCREKMRVLATDFVHDQVRVRYEADGAEAWVPYPDRLAKPKKGRCLAYGGHREASRITLEIASLRAERLQAITYEDICREGFDRCCAAPGEGHTWFQSLWDSINAKRAPWESNPWVWTIGVRRV